MAYQWRNGVTKISASAAYGKSNISNKRQQHIIAQQRKLKSVTSGISSNVIDQRSAIKLAIDESSGVARVCMKKMADVAALS